MATLSSIFAGESLGQRSPAGYCPGGRQESDSGTQPPNPQPTRPSRPHPPSVSRLAPSFAPLADGTVRTVRTLWPPTQGGGSL